MLVYYSNGANSEYTGSRKLDKLKEFTEKASIPSVFFLLCAYDSANSTTAPSRGLE